MPDLKTMLTSGEAARILGVSTEWVRQLTMDGVLPFTDTPLGKLFHREDVERLRSEREGAA